MLSSFYGILVMIALLFLPGFALLSFFKSCWNKTSWVDRLCMMLVLSGCWNYLFFLPRMAAETRFHFYLANSGILIMAALIFSRHSLTRFFKKPWPFVTNFFRAAAIPLFVFALGGFFTRTLAIVARSLRAEMFNFFSSKPTCFGPATVLWMIFMRIRSIFIPTF